MCMRFSIIIAVSFIFLISCNNSSSTGKSFCDTTCISDSFKFTGDSKFEPFVSIAIKNCNPDTLSWGHYLMDFNKQIHLPSFLDKSIKLNASAISCIIKDTSHAWLTFNDCITGRGYLLKLPFSKNGVIGKYTGALNSFDPKFSVSPNLRAFTDRGSLFVVDVETGKEATMSFGKAYDIDFNKIHEVVDSINVTNKKIYVKLLKDGQAVPIEKTIEL